MEYTARIEEPTGYVYGVDIYQGEEGGHVGMMGDHQPGAEVDFVRAGKMLRNFGWKPAEGQHDFAWDSHWWANNTKAGWIAPVERA